MQASTRVGRFVVLIAAGLGLAGCSGWSFSPPMRGNPVTEPINAGAVQPAAPAGNFNQSLAGEYGTLASSLANQQRDWADADYFGRKARAAAAGRVVPPEENGNWLIPLEIPNGFRTELANARTRLVTALNGGAAQSKPAVAARAQVSYDCWVEGMEDDWAKNQNGACKQAFLAAMCELDGQGCPAGQPPAAAQPGPQVPLREYRVYFEWNRANLLPEAQQILTRVADEAKRDTGLRIMLVGKADLSGSDAYNLRLSKRRADAVADALVKDGVPKARIDARWVGDREPPVPTPKGVREPRNRVVEINLR